MDAYRVAYDGSQFHGFQRQPDVETVSDTLLAGLRELGVTDSVPPRYAAAGRTDAGVSALAQTVAFEAPSWLSPAAINSVVPPTVRVWARASVPETFHATHDADSRTYEYYLYAPDGLTQPLADACDRLSGTHDFHNLTPDSSKTKRTLTIDAHSHEPFVVLRVTAAGFPRQLVRRLSTVCANILRGEWPLSRIDRVLSDTVLSGPDGIPPASPLPLVLTDVTYPEVTFEVTSRAIEVFADRSQDHAIQAQVLRRIDGGISTNR